MSLQREENNLRRAQARFDKVSRRSKQFQIDFRREANSRGRFHTRAYIVRGEKTHHGGRGIVHKFANAKYRIQGDKPSVTRTIKSWQPKTFKGKLFKANVRAVNFAVHDVAQTAVDTGLAAETGGIKTADTAQREVRNKLKQKYTREAVDDYHRGVFLVGRTAVDAVKGTHNHLKTKKQYKLEKAKLQLKKADNKLYKAKTQKPKMAATKADLKKAKAEYKARIVKDKGNTLRKAMNKRRLQAYKQTKRELNFERKQLKTEQQFRVKELRNQKKITRNSRPGLLALKPASYSVKRMKASAWQKAVNEDQDNDMLHAIDSAKRRIAEPVKDKISKPQWLQREEKKRDRLSDEKSKSNKKLNRQENKLNENHDKYKQRKKRKPKNKKTKKTVAERFKSAFKFVKNVYEKEVKKFFAAIAVPILIIFLVFAFIIMIFSSIVSGGGFTLGTYAAQDYDLSEAEKYYTELVYNFNQKILKVSDTSDWKKGLTAFGANKKDLKDKPDNWYWGKSSIYDWKPQYDFDCYKLWAFLSAYYYDFDADDNGDIKYWKFKSDTEDLLEYIFNAEYEFVYWYDNKSRWEELDTYVYFGGGSSTDGSYYYCEQSASKSNGAWTYKFKPTSYTSELGQYPHLLLGNLTALQLQQFYNDKFNSGLSGNSVKHYHANIHKALKYAVKMDMLDVNVADKVELPKIQKFEANFYNKDELEQLFEVFKGDRLELVVHIAAYYGLRKSEIIGLKWDSVNFEEKKLTVRRKVSSTYGGGKEMIFVENQLKTESSVRTFPLIPHIEQMLIERKNLEEYYSKLLGKDFDREYDGFVCRDNFGKLITPNFVTTHFKYIIKKNKLKHIRFHDLRHSCASLLLANGVSMKAIQEWLGHSTFNVTANFYSHLDFHSKVKSAETIAKVLGGDSTDTEQAIHDKGSEDEKNRKSST